MLAQDWHLSSTGHEQSGVKLGSPLPKATYTRIANAAADKDNQASEAAGLATRYMPDPTGSRLAVLHRLDELASPHSGRIPWLDFGHTDPDQVLQHVSLETSTAGEPDK
jgi:hypothetical protein